MRFREQKIRIAKKPFFYKKKIAIFYKLVLISVSLLGGYAKATHWSSG